MKDQVQELHRDLTKRHSLINTDTMGERLDCSLHIDRQINQMLKKKSFKSQVEGTTLTTPTTAKCLGKDTWIHVSHCKQVAEPEEDATPVTPTIQ